MSSAAKPPAGNKEIENSAVAPPQSALQGPGEGLTSVPSLDVDQTFQNCQTASQNGNPRDLPVFDPMDFQQFNDMDFQGPSPSACFNLDQPQFRILDWMSYHSLTPTPNQDLNQTGPDQLQQGASRDSINPNTAQLPAVMCHDADSQSRALNDAAKETALNAVAQAAVQAAKEEAAVAAREAVKEAVKEALQESEQRLLAKFDDSLRQTHEALATFERNLCQRMSQAVKDLVDPISQNVNRLVEGIGRLEQDKEAASKEANLSMKAILEAIERLEKDKEAASRKASHSQKAFLDGIDGLDNKLVQVHNVGQSVFEKVQKSKTMIRQEFNLIGARLVQVQVEGESTSRRLTGVESMQRSLAEEYKQMGDLRDRLHGQIAELNQTLDNGFSNMETDRTEVENKVITAVHGAVITAVHGAVITCNGGEGSEEIRKRFDDLEAKLGQMDHGDKIDQLHGEVNQLIGLWANDAAIQKALPSSVRKIVKLHSKLDDGSLEASQSLGQKILKKYVPPTKTSATAEKLRAETVKAGSKRKRTVGRSKASRVPAVNDSSDSGEVQSPGDFEES